MTIPQATPLNTYFLLACVDDPSKVGETNEKQLTPSSSTVTVTP